MDSRLHWNDAADLHENDVPAGVVTGKYPRHSPHSNLTMQICPTIVNPAQDQRRMKYPGWLLVTGYWLLVTGYWLLVTGYWLLVTGVLA